MTPSYLHILSTDAWTAQKSSTTPPNDASWFNLQQSGGATYPDYADIPVTAAENHYAFYHQGGIVVASHGDTRNVVVQQETDLTTIDLCIGVDNSGDYCRIPRRNCGEHVLFAVFHKNITLYDSISIIAYMTYNGAS